MMDPGQICRDRTCKTFKIVVVLGPSLQGGKLRVCRWHAAPSESADGRWSEPVALHEHQLAPLGPDFDLTTRHGLVVAAARRSIVDGKVRWRVGPRRLGENRITEIHYVGTVRP